MNSNFSITRKSMIFGAPKTLFSRVSFYKSQKFIMNKIIAIKYKIFILINSNYLKNGPVV